MEVPTNAMAITKTKRTKRVSDPVDDTQIDYDKLADAIFRRKNRPGPQLIQDNPSSDALRSSGIVVDNDVERPTLQPSIIEPQDASAGEMHVQHEMNSSLNMHETAQFSFLLALDQLYGGESLCRRQSLIEQCCSPASICRNFFGGNCAAQNKTKKLCEQIC